MASAVANKQSLQSQEDIIDSNRVHCDDHTTSGKIVTDITDIQPVEMTMRRTLVVSYKESAHSNREGSSHSRLIIIA